MTRAKRKKGYAVRRPKPPVPSTGDPSTWPKATHMHEVRKDGSKNYHCYCENCGGWKDVSLGGHTADECKFFCSKATCKNMSRWNPARIDIEADQKETARITHREGQKRRTQALKEAAERRAEKLGIGRPKKGRKPGANTVKALRARTRKIVMNAMGVLYFVKGDKNTKIKFKGKEITFDKALKHKDYKWVLGWIQGPKGRGSLQCRKLLRFAVDNKTKYNLVVEDRKLSKTVTRCDDAATSGSKRANTASDASNKRARST